MSVKGEGEENIGEVDPLLFTGFILFNSVNLKIQIGCTQVSYRLYTGFTGQNLFGKRTLMTKQGYTLILLSQL